MTDATNAAEFEAARSAALARYDILDTPKEAEFDDLAVIASEICETPISIVNLVDTGRQFFKAEVGVGEREVPLENAFCVHALDADEVLVVPDVTKDARFSRNPLVTEDPKIRFYAGALLKTADGFPIGTVCVLDTRPRELSAQQVRVLKHLARQAMTQLELRRILKSQEDALTQARILETELRAAVERQNDIAREMAHRIKNSLAIVQAVVSQTFRRSTDPQEARAAIVARLGALSRAQDALLMGNSEKADIRDVVETALEPHRTGEGRFSVEGPRLLLDAQRALGLSLAIHELSTNAAKYGALSNAEGAIHITWSLQGGRFSFRWSESGGPPVHPPGASGFGTRLVERVVASYYAGEGRLHYQPDGLIFELKSGWKS
ncbi:HWE histidine kinase domain-containing protein [Fulvimarina endophytica]|uniref:HWE histidine kinase domain-containing protein n=1 Tax=Fulvimarina endophytica TaxID=2293836 RepID=UPI001314857D|nr:HWE histidine kinase domain-containing protein [Fulvimarina endophytica]